MATSKVDLCNRVLTLCGAARINSLEETSQNAIVMKEEYDNSREELLASHPWNFAVKRVELAQSVDEPIYGYSYQFQLPNDCLRVLDTDLSDEWVIEGRYLLTNDDAVNIKYISNITDVSKFSRMFETAFVYMMADVVCFKISQNAALAQSIAQKAEKKLREARSFDAQEGTPPVSNNDDFLNVRF